MAALFVTFIVLICAISQGATASHSQSDEFILLINSIQDSWRAGRNFPQLISTHDIKKLMGTLKDDNLAKLQKLEHDDKFIAVLPKNFDPRKKWPKCSSLNEIKDQGSCSSCWALGAVEVMTDRYCIYSNGTKQFNFSAQDLLNCCETCGLGCIKGVPSAAWEYWVRVGIVSGGNYNSNQGCKPYKTPPGIISSHIFYIAGCNTSCDSNYGIDYLKDKRRGKIVYTVDRNEKQIKAELFKNGPVEGVMDVYEDFLYYKSGVYRLTEGHLLGHHAVKILGWGEERGHKHWLVANSWSQHWGDKGFFKILRGENHCGIEDSIVTGEPIIV